MTDSESDDGFPLGDEIPLALLKSKHRDSKTCSTTADQTVGDIQNTDTVLESQNVEVRGSSAEIGELQELGPVYLADTDMLSELGSDDMSVCDYDSDRDPEFYPGTCEVRRCNEVVFAACPDCETLLCYDHINEDSMCTKHGTGKRGSTEKDKEDETVLMPINITTEVNANGDILDQCQTMGAVGEDRDEEIQRSVPEQYTVEGSEKEVRKEKEPRLNKQKEAKMKRNLGQEYKSVKTRRIVPAKRMKARCKGDTCAKQKK